MKKARILSVLLSAIMCFGIIGGTFSASAASVSVHLTKTQATNSSSNVYGTFKYYWGKNSSSSQHSVYFISRYKSGAIWLTGNKYLMRPGESKSEEKAIVTPKFETKRDWFLKLNPEGANNKGCDAWGYMKNA